MRMWRLMLLLMLIFFKYGCYCWLNWPDTAPGSEGHDTMMENVKGGEVHPFLSEHKEKGVDGVHQLWKEEPPGHICCQHALFGIWIVHWLTKPIVPTSQPEVARLLEQPQTEKGLEEIVGNHEQLDVIWLAVLHESRPCAPDDVDIESGESKHRPRRGHEEPIIHPGSNVSGLVRKKWVTYVLWCDDGCCWLSDTLFCTWGPSAHWRDGSSSPCLLGRSCLPWLQQRDQLVK